MRQWHSRRNDLSRNDRSDSTCDDQDRLVSFFKCPCKGDRDGQWLPAVNCVGRGRGWQIVRLDAHVAMLSIGWGPIGSIVFPGAANVAPHCLKRRLEKSFAS